MQDANKGLIPRLVLISLVALLLGLFSQTMSLVAPPSSL